MKKIILMTGISLAAAGLVMADFDSEMLAAAALCKDNKHAEAIQAWINLGDSCPEPEKQYQAVSKAAECARFHGTGEPQALEICVYLKTEPYGKACRAFVYQWASSASNVMDEFQSVDFSEWPEDLAAIGYKIRANAYFNLKNGGGAAHDYLKAFQCSKSYDKWSAFCKLGDTYWKLLDDQLLAEACYRKCVSDFGGGWPGLTARVNLATLLLSQKRYDAALQCLQAAADRPGAGYWLVALLYMEAKVYADMDNKNQAIATLQTALKTVGIIQSQQKDCEKMLSELKPGATPQSVPPAK
jgi:tetratricopeptide (TPR) repeat protein